MGGWMFITMGDRLKLNRETGIQYVVFDQSNETQAQSIEVIGLRGSNSGPTLKEAIVASSPAGERQPAQVPALSPPADVEQPMRIDDVRAHWMIMICMRERIDFARENVGLYSKRKSAHRETQLRSAR